MNRWIAFCLRRATWRFYAAMFIAWFAYNLWAINMDSLWTRALKAAGGKLPESQLGFIAEEPSRSLDALGPSTGEYIFWQALDVPYALSSLVVTAFAIALGLKALRLQASSLRLLLLAPPLYVACEAVENPLVAAFAAKWIAPTGAVVLVQQAATTLKLLSGYGSMGLGMLGVALAALASVVRRFRKGA